MLGELSPWHLLILAALVLVLFGAKKLPDSARSLGRAMRIFKAETQGLRGDDKIDDYPGQARSASPQSLTPPQSAAQVPAEAPVAAAAPVDAQRTSQS